MNAIIGLCHFCEAHGPRPIFCTFTTDNEEHATNPSTCAVQCNGCTSLGPETVLVSKDDDGTIFCSRQSVPNAEVTTFLKQAAIRSITCEVSWSKEGGMMYFSDRYGHVLSSTFQLRDTRARGLNRWFSIVVLMRDKMLLLNISTLLSGHVQEISKELQQRAQAVFDKEQQVCSQRALRLNTGRNDFGQSRSLTYLTGDVEVFTSLHSKFTWMLQAGACVYSEMLYSSQNLLNKLNPNTSKGWTLDSGACLLPSENECMSLRALERLVTKEIFRPLLYCTLNGITVNIKTSHRDPSTIVYSLARLLPVLNKEVELQSIKSCSEEQTEPSSCVLEETEYNHFCLKCSGTIPARCPTLMKRIESALGNEKLQDSVLHQHVKCLQLEWLGLARAVKAAMQASPSGAAGAVVQLKQVLGVAPHDYQLLTFWMDSFC